MGLKGLTHVYSAVLFTGSLTGIPEGEKTLFIVMISAIEVAIHEAQLGGMEEVMSCVKNADVLKPAKAAADGLLKEIAGDKGGRRYWEGL